MPAGVKFSGRNGTVLTIGGANYLAKMKSHTVTIDSDVVEHNGPQDVWRYRTWRRGGAALKVDSFIMAAGLSADLVLAIAGSPVLVTSNLVGGSTLTGTFIITRAEAKASDDPDEWSVDLESTGTFAFTG